MSMTEEMVARIAKLERKLAALEVKERPLALRGHRDDFLGRSLDVRYEQSIAGGGSITLQALHGGVVRLRCGNLLNEYANLILGNAADAYTTLDADEGWVQIWRGQVPILTQLQATAGGYEFTTGTHIYAGFRVDVSAVNWILRCTGVGTTNVDTGVAADTQYHVHRLETYPITGGRRVDYYLDGAPIGSCSTANVTGNLLSPVLLNVNRVGGAVRDWYVDFWDVIPMNLV